MNPYLLAILGLLLAIEAHLTPGSQIAGSLVGGGMFGWNLGRIRRGGKG